MADDLGGMVTTVEVSINSQPADISNGTQQEVKPKKVIIRDMTGTQLLDEGIIRGRIHRASKDRNHIYTSQDRVDSLSEILEKLGFDGIEQVHTSSQTNQPAHVAIQTGVSGHYSGLHEDLGEILLLDRHIPDPNLQLPICRSQPITVKGNKGYIIVSTISTDLTSRKKVRTEQPQWYRSQDAHIVGRQFPVVIHNYSNGKNSVILKVTSPDTIEGVLRDFGRTAREARNYFGVTPIVDATYFGVHKSNGKTTRNGRKEVRVYAYKRSPTDDLTGHQTDTFQLYRVAARTNSKAFGTIIRSGEAGYEEALWFATSLAHSPDGRPSRDLGSENAHYAVKVEMNGVKRHLSSI